MSLRDLPAPLHSEVEQPSVHAFIAVEITFAAPTPSNPAGAVSRAWTGYTDLVINGQTYRGIGDFGRIGTIPQTSENKAVGIQLTLSGVPTDVIAAALNQNYQGRPCNVYFGALEEQPTGRAIVGAPYKIFGGRVDTMTLEEAKETASITINVESQLIDMDRVREGRYTDADQQAIHMGDTGLEYVPGLQEKEILWGA